MIYGAEGDPYTYILSADGAVIGVRDPSGQFKVVEPGSAADQAILAQVESGQLAEQPDAVEKIDQVPEDMLSGPSGDVPEGAEAEPMDSPETQASDAFGADVTEKVNRATAGHKEKLRAEARGQGYQGNRDGIIARLMGGVTGSADTPILDEKLGEAREAREAKESDAFGKDVTDKVNSATAGHKAKLIAEKRKGK